LGRNKPEAGVSGDQKFIEVYTELLLMKYAFGSGKDSTDANNYIGKIKEIFANHGVDSLWFDTYLTKNHRAPEDLAAIWDKVSIRADSLLAFNKFKKTPGPKNLK